MPLFQSNTQTRRSPTSPNRRNASPNQKDSSGGLFSRNSRSTEDSGSSTSSRHASGSGGFFGLNRSKGLDNDPTIRAARQKISDAERAERGADEALRRARQTAHDAREHVKILEREALQESRLAKAKQAEAKVINKSAKGLGRH